MDSLRYWVTEMHVDGFRFDLASTLAREFYDVDRLSAFFDLVQQDPVVSQVKLIAEPWDVGEGGYQVGNFPPLWTEWNGKYRDTVRDLLARRAGDARRVRLPAHRLVGPVRGRRPPPQRRRSTSSPRTTASRCDDLVSYNEKHNEANGEDNRDGESHNRSWNCGVEGPTDDPRDHRAARHARSATSSPRCCCRQGVPMIAHGDEIGRTQHGNNNVYCQDNELSWIDWDDARDNEVLIEFTAQCRRAARRAPGVPPPAVLRGPPDPAAPASRDIAWLRPDGQEMTDEDWDVAASPEPSRCSSTARASPTVDERGERVDRRLVPAVLQRPPPAGHLHAARRRATAGAWEIVVDTTDPLLANARRKQRDAVPGGRLRVQARAMLVLRCRY